MIEVRTWDEPNRNGIGFTLSGHATYELTDREGTQVCAGVSALVMTLFVQSGQNGEISENGGGFCKFIVSPKWARHAEFAYFGLLLIDRAYPNRIRFEQQDSWLDEVSEWLPKG